VPNIVQHKRTSTSGNTPTVAQLSVGEIALNFVDRQIFTNFAGTIIELTKFLRQTNGESNNRRLRLGEHSDPVATVDVKGNFAMDTVTVAGGVVNCALSNQFSMTIAANTNVTFTGVPTGRAYGCTISVSHTAGTCVWPPEVKWANGGTAPNLTANKTSLFMLRTQDGGTNWLATSLVDY